MARALLRAFRARTLAAYHWHFSNGTEAFFARVPSSSSSCVSSCLSPSWCESWWLTCEILIQAVSAGSWRAYCCSPPCYLRSPSANTLKKPRFLGSSPGLGRASSEPLWAQEQRDVCGLRPGSELVSGHTSRDVGGADHEPQTPARDRRCPRNLMSVDAETLDFGL